MRRKIWIISFFLIGVLFNLLEAQVGSPITTLDTNYGDSGGTGMLYLNEGAPQIINEGPSIGNPNLFEVVTTGGTVGTLGARELCDFALVGMVTEGPDFLIEIIVPVGKRISCQDATFTICRRGDFGHPSEKVYIVDEDGIVIAFVDSSGGGGASDCSPDQQCVSGTISPCAINSMTADGVIRFGIHTPGGNPGTTAADVDAVCVNTSGGQDGDYNNDGTIDGNCVELTAFSYVVDNPDSSFTVDAVASELVDGMIYCPNEVINIQANQMNSCDQQLTVNGTDINNGNYTLTTPGDYTICNTVGYELCELLECITVVVQEPSVVEAGPDEIICAGVDLVLAGANTIPDSAFWRILPNSGDGNLSDTSTTNSPEDILFNATIPGTYTLVLTTIGLCDTVQDTRQVTVNGTTANNVILYVSTCDVLVADFTLSDADNLVTNGTIPTYHASLSDATSNTGTLVSPYNAVDGTIVYARVEDPNNGCVAYAEVTLRVIPNNAPSGPDKDMDGISDGADRDDDNDGISDELECNQAFDLSNRSMLVGADPADLQIGDKVLYDNAITVGGIVYDLVGELTDASFSDPMGAVSIVGSGDPFDLIFPKPQTDDYATMKLSLVVNGSATAVTPMGTMATIPYIFISINDIDSDNEDYTDIAGISYASDVDNIYLNSPTNLIQGQFVNGGGPIGFQNYYVDPTSAGTPTDWVDEVGVTGVVASTINAVKIEILNFSMLEILIGVTGNIGNPTFRFSRIEIETCPDSDGDGIPNHKDLDSDNDGIPDAIEACGDINVVLNDCMLDIGTYTSNNTGSPLNCPNGMYQTTCSEPQDTDMDNIPDYLDTDSDGDGCDDSCEAEVSDPDADGIAGNGTPVVDDCGRVAGNCWIPTDTTWIDTTVQFSLAIIGDCEVLSAQDFPSIVSFQWYFNDSPIIGATNATYVPSPRTYGDYSVEATKTATCKVTSSIITTCCEPPAVGISGN